MAFVTNKQQNLYETESQDTTFSVCDDRPEMRSQSAARPAGKGGDLFNLKIEKYDKS